MVASEPGVFGACFPCNCVALQVVRENLYDAFYKLTDSRAQIRSYVSLRPAAPLLLPPSGV